LDIDIVVLCLTLLVGISAARGTTVHVKWVSVTRLDRQGQTFHGYLPHVFDIRNTHPTLPAEVRVALIDYSGRSLEKTVTVQAGRQLRTTLYQPAAVFGNLNRFTVTVAGAGSSEPAHFPVNQHGGNHRYSHYARGFGGPTALLFSRRFKTETYQDALTQALLAPGAAGGGPRHSGVAAEMTQVIRAGEEIEAWDSDWLAYSPYDAVALHADEYRLCQDIPVGKALEDYLVGGGTVAVFGAAADHAETIGFGRLLRYQAAAPENLTADQMTDLYLDLEKYSQFWSPRISVSQAHSQLPILDNLDIPFRSFMGTMAVFAILMGPVSIGVLARKNRRIWLLWVIPAISLGASAFVYLGNLAREGTGRTAVARGIVFLDQQRNVAAAIAWSGYYSPRKVRSLQYPTTTEVTPLEENYRGRPRGSIVFGDKQRLVDGWMKSRIPEYFVLRDVAPSRERVQVGKEDGKLYVLNGLSVGLKAFHVNLGPDGAWRFPREIPAGAKVQLESCLPGGGAAVRGVFEHGTDFPSRLAAAAIAVPPGHYAAESLGPYRVVNGIDNDAQVSGSVVVVGRLEAN
jgi:hypothetical protein